jgi:tetratricopeptide (TPR) repeat protein
VRALLGLQQGVAAQVAERTAGNPLFAIQLVGDWVERGLLELQEDGFALRPGVPVQLPDDLHQVWASRIERLLDGRNGEGAQALELAAVLGQDVNTEEWRAVCTRRGAAFSLDLIEAMVEERLATAADKGPSAGWSFVHGMLRESLLRRAAEAGRIKAHHLTCAEMLRRSKGRTDAARLGRHLLQGGEPEAALEPLVDGVIQELQCDGFWSAESLLADRERALELASRQAADERRGMQWVLRGQLAHAREEYEDAERWARRAEEQARANGWTSVLAWVFVLLSECAMSRWEMMRCLEHLAEAEVHAGRLKDSRLSGECALKAGTALTRLGRFDEAAQRLVEARESLEQVGDRVGGAYCSYGLCVAYERAGDLDESRRHLAHCRAAFEKAGSRRGVALSLNSEGELARRQGNLEAAETAYHASKELFETLSSWREWAPMTNLGLIRIAQKKYDEARDFLEQGLSRTLLAGSRASAGVVHACLLPCFAAAEDWESWDRHFVDAEKILRASGWVDPDIAEMSSLAADMAQNVDQLERAARAYRLSETQWRGIGREDEARFAAARHAEAVRRMG